VLPVIKPERRRTFIVGLIGMLRGELILEDGGDDCCMTLLSIDSFLTILGVELELAMSDRAQIISRHGISSVYYI